jgi:formamidopyrimidine-DNA glycosylase
MDPGGIDVFTASPEAFMDRLRSENRTLKRALTDPRLLSGIGNAYSDEILFAAGMSPVRRTRSLSDDELGRLQQAVIETLQHWAQKLRDETPGFPEKVTAFRPDFAMHGKFGKPCPRCQGPVQRIRYADNESNYCPGCQTDGKLLADRSLSRLLGDDWPKSLEELEERKQLGTKPPKKTAAKRARTP